MAGNDDFGKLIAAAVVGGAVALLAASAVKSQRESERASFQAALHSALAFKGWNLVAASLGATARGSHFWVLTMADALDRLRSVRVDVPLGTPPYDRSTVPMIINQVPRAA